MSLDLTDDQSKLVQVMAWCRQATSHYLSQCWPRSMLPYGVIWPQWVNVNVWCSHEISWKCVSKNLISDESKLAPQIPWFSVGYSSLSMSFTGILPKLPFKFGKTKLLYMIILCGCHYLYMPPALPSNWVTLGIITSWSAARTLSSDIPQRGL